MHHRALAGVQPNGLHARRPAPAHAARRSSRRRHAQAVDAAAAELDELLAWASPGLPQLKCAVRTAAPSGVRGLVATQPIAAGEVILRVPWSRVYKSQVGKWGTQHFWAGGGARAASPACMAAACHVLRHPAPNTSMHPSHAAAEGHARPGAALERGDGAAAAARQARVRRGPWRLVRVAALPAAAREHAAGVERR